MDNRSHKKISQDNQHHRISPLNGVFFTCEFLRVTLILSYFMNGLGDAGTIVFWRDTGATS